MPDRPDLVGRCNSKAARIEACNISTKSVNASLTGGMEIFEIRGGLEEDLIER
jgi:hypothetical protein